MYYVKRTYGKNSDFLKDWDDEYGTVCIGSKKLAMTFDDMESAQNACIRASLECKGVKGCPKPIDMTFSVIKSTL